jgi:hypothetical protein
MMMLMMVVVVVVTHLCFRCIQATVTSASLTQHVKDESRLSYGLEEE